jgi:hypothetical protein
MVLVSDTTIKTASISIQTVRIGAKQMNLSVFRQLPKEHPLDLSLDGSPRLKGTPWGWVDYWPDDCCLGTFRDVLQPGLGPCRFKTLHVLWESEGILKRHVVHSIVRKAWDRNPWVGIYGDRQGIEFARRIFDDDVDPNENPEEEWNKSLRGFFDEPELESFVREWNKLIEQIEQCDQLFIAV